jgi:hypothetical protein
MRRTSSAKPTWWLPAQALPGLGGVAQKHVHLAGPKVAGVDFHILLPIQVQVGKGRFLCVAAIVL